MKVTITPEAAIVIDKKIEPKSGFIIALNDGSNNFSRVGGSCAIGDKFQILPLTAKYDAFNLQLDNPDYEVYTSKAEAVFLGEAVKIDFHDRLGNFSLTNETGILDNNLLLKV